MKVALATRAHAHPLGIAEIDLVTRALSAVGVDAEPLEWTDPTQEPERFDAVIVRSTWDYPERLDEFLAWTRRVERSTRLWNSAALIAWNVHKRYLLELEANDVAIPPTRLLKQGAPASLDDIMHANAWDAVVIKPAVGVVSIGAMRVTREDTKQGQAHLDDLLSKGDALVQEYLPSIATRGETSIFAFEGELSYSVRKTPKAGDYRVQEAYGGITVPAQPTGAEADLARRVLSSVPELPLYARVDLVALADGTPALMELEAIEPYLFLESAEQAAPYARAVAQRLH